MRNIPPLSAIHQNSASRQFRIIHFIHEDGDGGGPYSVSKHITFYSHFYHVHVVHGGRGRISETCEDLGIPHTRIESDNIWDMLFSLPILVGIIISLKPDLLILHGQWAGPVGVIAGRLAAVRRILYVAHWPAYFTDWDFRRMVRNWISEWLPCTLANRVVAISRANFVTYLQMFPSIKEKLILLSNSIDQGEFPSEKEITEIIDQPGWASNKIHIVSVGRLNDQKRVDWLLKAWAECRDIWDIATLWIVGDGPERRGLERFAAEKQLGNSCRFLGSQPRGILYIAAADIVVFTSMYESFGNVTLEAMLCGKPIIASRVAGIESTLAHEEQGFLVAPGNIRDLAARLRELAKNPVLRKEMGQAGQLRAMQFSTSIVLPRFQALVDQMLAIQ